MSIYDPLLPEPSAHEARDLDRVREEFRQASRPFLGSAATWLAWSIVVPAAALITRNLPAEAYAAVLLTWSAAILLAGAVEAFAAATGLANLWMAWSVARRQEDFFTAGSSPRLWHR